MRGGVTDMESNTTPQPAYLRSTDVNNLDRLLPEEIEELRYVYTNWRNALKSKNYVVADRYRWQFYWWDTTLGIDGVWYPQFEHPLNRQRRAYRRMNNYHIDVYPFRRK